MLTVEQVLADRASVDVQTPMGVVTVDYRPSAVTLANEEAPSLVYARDVVEAWDLLEEDGAEYPRSDASLACLPSGFLDAVRDEITADMAGDEVVRRNLRRALMSPGFGAIPPWYPYLRASRYLQVPVWDLIRQPVVYRNWALTAEIAEQEAAAEIRKEIERKRRR